MRVLCSNHASKAFMDLARIHPDKLGWILGPSHWKTPRAELPFALDNDAFIAWKNGTAWNKQAWLRMLDKVDRSGLKPIWAIVPDVVADREGTLKSWAEHYPIIRDRGWPAAFAVQDRMVPADVPRSASIVFVGGTTAWKWRSLPMWTESFPRCHVGRVRITKLPIAERLGAESVDGTGFFRETIRGRPARQLIAWLEERNHQHELAFTP